MTEERWSIAFAPRGAKDMKRLDPPVRRRIYAALGRLAANDPTVQERKLENMGEWRVRVGDWRVRFSRDHKTHTLVIHRVLPRGRAYDR